MKPPPFQLDNIPLTYYIENYTDLCKLLLINPTSSKHLQPSANTNPIKALLAYKTKYVLPKSIKYQSASAHLIENLMYRAIQHWCCISFKIVPIELELIKKDTPKTILYCVAAISMVTTSAQTPHQKEIASKTTVAEQGFKKDVGFYFYERAVNYLKEIIFPEDEDSDKEKLSLTAIQCYFCLSYTSNLLLLTNEQKTWHFLACDQLKSKVDYINISPALRQCWYRWYYIDAWIALALNMECLLPDKLPFVVKRPSKIHNVKQGHQESDGCVTKINKSNNGHGNCCIVANDLHEFVIMTQYMRRYNRCIQIGTLYQMYDSLTYELEEWWSTIEDLNIHLSICYHSMRLVVLFSLLQQSHLYPINFNLLLDGLNITLEILQGLQELKLMDCDQSTYHHMFFAIHRTLKAILTHIKSKQEFSFLESFAKQQFEMNLCILEGTDAFLNDIYGMRALGRMIENDLHDFGYIDDDETNTKRAIHVFRTQFKINANKRPKHF